MLTTADESTSKSLLVGLRDRDPNAWARVAEIYGPAIETWCRQSRLPTREVDEVVQRVMMAVISDVASYRERHPNRSFRKWLWTVTHHKLADTYREFYRMQLLTPSDVDTLLVDDGFEQHSPPDNPALIGETLRRALEVVRKRCEPRTWDIFMRSVQGEGSNEFIAADFDTTAGNVRLIKMRMLARIHAVLEVIDETNSETGPMGSRAESCND